MAEVIWDYWEDLDHKTNEFRMINVWPDDGIWVQGPMFRNIGFNGTIRYSFPHNNPKRLYAAGNHLFVTEDEGRSWEMISPDLTTNDKTRQAASGGPDNKRQYWCRILLHHIHCNGK